MASLLTASTSAVAEQIRVYVGTYTQTDSKGIYLFEMDTSTGQPTSPRVVAELVNPSFLTFDPDLNYLYAVNEVSEVPGPNGRGTGGVTGFSIEAATGNLSKLNSQISKGTGPCHLCVDKTGKVVVVANYGGGSVALLPILPGGMLGEATSFFQHEGHSVDRGRQEGPHAHSANIDAQNRFAMVADLGLDKVMIYKLDAAHGVMTPNDPPFVSLQPGGGPRHFSFHPNGKYAYTNLEMQSAVTALAFDADTGALSPIDTNSTLPVDYREPGNSTAECLCHPSGKFVYVSNRGHNSIAIFQVREDGSLKPAGHASTRGEIPRNFGIDPSGKFLLAANQNSGTVVIFTIDPDSGGLTSTGHVVEIPMPVCVRFAHLR